MKKTINFLFPIDGDCLNAYDGTIADNGIEITVKVKGTRKHELYINSSLMTEDNGIYTGRVVLNGFRNALVCEDKKTGEQQVITVFKLNDPIKKYRISSDDNIIFLYDLTKNKDKYKSIFENPYLAVYKKAHDLYGAKVHLNLFYEFDDQARSFFSNEREYFNLSMMTDKFKKEFKANSDWLKLAFHAYSEFPDKPYEKATREKITNDCIKIVKEIIRFAGEEVLSDTTTIHWGEANRDCVKGLRALGINTLAGYFDPDENGNPIVSYYFSKEETDHIHERDFWYDKSEDMFFGKIDCVSNIGSLSEAMERIDKAVKNPHTGGFISVMIHEQYFHEDYVNYLYDFDQRVLMPAEFLTKQGYVGEHMTNLTREPRHNKAEAFHK